MGIDCMRAGPNQPLELATSCKRFEGVLCTSGIRPEGLDTRLVRPVWTRLVALASVGTDSERCAGVGGGSPLAAWHCWTTALTENVASATVARQIPSRFASVLDVRHTRRGAVAATIKCAGIQSTSDRKSGPCQKGRHEPSPDNCPLALLVWGTGTESVWDRLGLQSTRQIVPVSGSICRRVGICPFW